MMADQDFHWDRPWPSPSFTMVPNVFYHEILRHLTGTETKVLDYLMFRAYEWGGGEAEASLKQIVTVAGVSRGAAQSALKELERVGLVEMLHRNADDRSHLANLYRVRVSDDERYMRRRGPVPSTGIGVPDSGTSLSHGPGQDKRGRTLKERIHKGKEAAIHQVGQKTWDDRFCSGCLTNRCLPSCPAQECPDRRAQVE